MPYSPRFTGQNPYGPEVTFRTEDVLPPSAAYVSMDDTPVAYIIASAGYLSFTLALRMLLPEGTIKVDEYESVNSPPGSGLYNIVVPPVEGYILSSFISLNATLDGSAWCTFALYKGSVSLPLVSLPPNAGMVISQGYVDAWSWLSYPLSPIIEGGMGSGRMRHLMATPLPGNNWKIQASSIQRWEIVAVQSRLTTSAAAANRQMSLEVFDRLGNPVVRFPTNFTQAASLTYGYYFYNSAAHIQTNAIWITAPIPQGLYLDCGMSLQSVVFNLDAGDSWSFVDVLAREWMGVSHS